MMLIKTGTASQYVRSKPVPNISVFMVNGEHCLTSCKKDTGSIRKNIDQKTSFRDHFANKSIFNRSYVSIVDTPDEKQEQFRR